MIPPSMKRAALTGIRVLAIALVLVVGLEGLSSVFVIVADARATPHAPANFRQAQYDTLLGWIGLPNFSRRDNYGPGLTLTTNADGMRIHRPVSAALALGEKRIICSGDSFAFGSGVSDDETFCAYLEQSFPAVRTLNMSQRGFGIDQAYLWYKRDAVRYPHQVHLFTFIWHDFERMALTSFTGYPKPKLALKDGQLVVTNVPVPQWSGRSDETSVGALVSDTRLIEFAQRRFDQSDAAKLRRVDDQVWNVAEAVFRDLAKLNKERGSSLVLVYLPAPPDLTPGPYDVRRERMEQFSKANGIPFIDLTTAIRAVSADSLDWMFITPNALPVDGASGHYTASGHRWVAAQLAARLRTIPSTAAALSPASR